MPGEAHDGSDAEYWCVRASKVNPFYNQLNAPNSFHGTTVCRGGGGCERKSVCVHVHLCKCVSCKFLPTNSPNESVVLAVFSVTKTNCPSVCPERCFGFEGSLFCCDTICAAGCRGTTESDCVVSVKGGAERRWESEALE